MSKTGPIVIIEDDLDDHHILEEVFKSLAIKNEIKILFNGEKALEYLRETMDVPFIILCDINMPRINGLQLRSEIESSPVLKKKSIPFIFFSTVADKATVEKAYDLTVQGYFAKGSDLNHLRKQIKMIVDYWMECKHPNAFTY